MAQGSRAYTHFIVPEGGSSQFFKIPPAAPLSLPAARAPLLADGPRLRQVRLAAMVGGISPAVRQALQQDSARTRACDQARVALRTGLYTPSGGAEPSFAKLAQRARDPAVGALLRAHDAVWLQLMQEMNLSFNIPVVVKNRSSATVPATNARTLSRRRGVTSTTAAPHGF